jgi:hypothetical protein
MRQPSDKKAQPALTWPAKVPSGVLRRVSFPAGDQRGEGNENNIVNAQKSKPSECVKRVGRSNI